MPELPEIVILSTLVFVVVASAVPGYVIARRVGLGAPAVAFIPIVGLWINLLRSIGMVTLRWALLIALWIAVPFVGIPAVIVWTAVQVPVQHRRSRWWTALLIVPVVNVVGYWAYAFTLPAPARESARVDSPPAIL